MAKATKDADKIDGDDEERINRAPPDEDLAEVLADMPQDATVAVRRVGGGRQEFIANMDAVSLTEEYAAENFGPGQYRCKYSWADAQGRKAYRTHKTITISEDAARRYGFYDKKRDRDEDDTARGRSRGDIVDAGIAGLLTASAEAMRAQREGNGNGNTDLILAMMKDSADNARAQAAAQAAAAERTTTMITTLIGSLVPVFTALIARKPDDPMAVATKMAELLKPAVARGDGGGSGGMKEALESLALLLDMKERLAGSDEADDVPTALIKNFAGPFGRLVEAYAQRREETAPPTGQEVKVVDATQPARIGAGPAASPATPAPATPATPQDDGAMMIGQFKDALRGWCVLAKARRDPHTYAQVTWDEFTALPKHLRDIAIGFLAETVDGTEDGEFALEATAAKWVPEVAQYPAWFREFFDALRELAGIIEPADEDDDMAAPPPAPAKATGGK